MKIIFIFILSILPLVSKNIYLTQSSSSVDELEAKIISQIAKAFLMDPKIYISGGNIDLNIYFAKHAKVEFSCENANFIYIKEDSTENLDISKCSLNKRVFFTDNKEIYEKNNEVIGAFFWFKSRPNIKLSSNRAKNLELIIPNNYQRFVDNK